MSDIPIKLGWNPTHQFGTLLEKQARINKEPKEDGTHTDYKITIKLTWIRINPVGILAGGITHRLPKTMIGTITGGTKG